MDARDGQVAPGERLALPFPRNHNGIPSRNNKIFALASSTRKNAKPRAKTKVLKKKEQNRKKKKRRGVSAPHSRDRAARAFVLVINVDMNNETLRPQGDRAARLCSRDARAEDNRRNSIVTWRFAHRLRQ